MCTITAGCELVSNHCFFKKILFSIFFNEMNKKSFPFDKLSFCGRNVTYLFCFFSFHSSELSFMLHCKKKTSPTPIIIIPSYSKKEDSADPTEGMDIVIL